jgi:hypothetical protein
MKRAKTAWKEAAEGLLGVCLAPNSSFEIRNSFVQLVVRKPEALEQS